MDLRQLLSVLRKRWGYVALVTLLGIGGGIAASALATTEYQATSEQFVSFADTGDQANNLQSGSQFTLQRVQSYTKVVTSERVLGPVIQQLQLGLTVQELGDEITATNPLNTVLIQITVTETDPRQAAAIANAVSNQFATVIADIETPTDGGAAPVKITTTQPATPPTVPSSPRKKLNLALGLVIGLALGIGLALLRDQFDTTVKSPEDLEALTGAIPLGIVSFDPTAKSAPLISQTDHGIRSEAFRTLRTNLQFTDVDHPPKVIVVTSPLAGDGKSTTACNIAITLGASGARVMLIEADLRRPRASHYLGLDSSVGLTNLLAGQYVLDDLATDWGGNTIDFVPSGPIPPNPSELLGSQHMAQLIGALREQYDYVIIDAPPLLPVTDAAVVATLADGALIVTRHGKTTRDQAARAVDALGIVNARLIGTLLNFVPRKSRASYGDYRYYSYEAKPEQGKGKRAKRKQEKRRASTHAGPQAQVEAKLPPSAAARPRPTRETGQQKAPQARRAAASVGPPKPVDLLRPEHVPSGARRPAPTATAASPAPPPTPPAAPSDGPPPRHVALSEPITAAGPDVAPAPVPSPVPAEAPARGVAQAAIPGAAEARTFDPHGALLAGWAIRQPGPPDGERGDAEGEDDEPRPAQAHAAPSAPTGQDTPGH